MTHFGSFGHNKNDTFWQKNHTFFPAPYSSFFSSKLNSDYLQVFEQSLFLFLCYPEEERGGRGGKKKEKRDLAFVNKRKVLKNVGKDKGVRKKNWPTFAQ